jgi:hypothetical protein
MIRRSFVGVVLGTGLAGLASLVAVGCGDSEGQPSRGSISAPRGGGGGIQDTKGEKLKGQGGAPTARPGGGKAGATPD